MPFACFCFFFCRRSRFYGYFHRHFDFFDHFHFFHNFHGHFDLFDHFYFPSDFNGLGGRWLAGG